MSKRILDIWRKGPLLRNYDLHLHRDITVIGRAKNKVDFFIDSTKNRALISRIHARISKSQTQSGQDLFKIHDVSLNGTYVNDTKISSEGLLTPGDIVVFGHVQGACLEAGNQYKQLNSEFKFMFECFYDGTENLNNFTTDDGTANNVDKKPTVQSLSKFLETPTAPPVQSDSGSSNCHTRRLFENIEDNNDSEVEFEMLKEYASTAACSFTNQSDSDEELFSVKYKQILPGHNHQPEKPKTEEKPKESENSKSPDKKRKRRRSKRETVSKSQHTNNDDRCSATKCINPDGKIVSWVQCDDCDKWYHIKCCGLSLRLVKVKNSKFHCGCS